MNWSEGRIGRALARNTFAGDLCVLDNCIWTGHEADLLVVTPTLRIIDVEIKISRADLKADKDKGKWWRQPPYVMVDNRYVRPDAIPRAYPPEVWKHYYAMPEEIWREDLREHIQPVSGVLLLVAAKNERGIDRVKCIKRAKPNRDAQTLSDKAVVQLARLASLRMWDAYKQVEQAQAKQVAA